MTRAVLFLCLCGSVWIAEGVTFSGLLQFSGAQVVLVIGVYTTLWSIASVILVRSLRSGSSSPPDLPSWRALSVGPMLVAVLGSFVSLPILLAIAALGKVL